MIRIERGTQPMWGLANTLYIGPSNGNGYTYGGSFVYLLQIFSRCQGNTQRPRARKVKKSGGAHGERGSASL